MSAPKHPLMEFIVNSIWKIYEEDGKSFKMPADPGTFVHYYTGPWAFTRGIAEFFGYSFDVKNHGYLAR